MRKAVTTREEILQICQENFLELVRRNFDLRYTASLSGISVGTLYNYFGGKSDLMIDTILSIWNRAFQSFLNTSFASFPQCLDCLAQTLAALEAEFPDFLHLHARMATGADHQKMAQTMKQTLQPILDHMADTIEKDPNRKPDLLSENLDSKWIAQAFFDLLVRQENVSTDQIRSLKTMASKLIYA